MADFDKQQERLWKTVDRFKQEYRRYLESLDPEELIDEFMEMAVDRHYAAFTTDLVMNALLEEGWIDEKESNKLPTDFFREQIKDLAEKRKKKRTAKKTTKKATKKVAASKKKVAKKATKKNTKKKA